MNLDRRSRLPRVVAVVLAMLAGLLVTLTASPASAAAATHLVVSAPANATAGISVSVTVTAQDGGGVTDPTATQVVHFTSSDPQAVLPADTPLAAGTATVPVTFKTAGNQTVTATDTSAVPLTPGTSARSRWRPRRQLTSSSARRQQRPRGSPKA